VDAEVRLAVADEVVADDLDGSRDRKLPDTGLHGLAAIADGSRLADVHGDDLHRRRDSSIATF
jgi:hypothetical protein